MSGGGRLPSPGSAFNSSPESPRRDGERDTLLSDRMAWVLPGALCGPSSWGLLCSPVASRLALGTWEAVEVSSGSEDVKKGGGGLSLGEGTHCWGPQVFYKLNSLRLLPIPLITH